MSQVNGMELWWSVKGRLLPPIYNGEWMLCYYLNPQKRFWIWEKKTLRNGGARMNNDTTMGGVEGGLRRIFYCKIDGCELLTNKWTKKKNGCLWYCLAHSLDSITQKGTTIFFICVYVCFEFQFNSFMYCYLFSENIPHIYIVTANSKI